MAQRSYGAICCGFRELRRNVLPQGETINSNSSSMHSHLVAVAFGIVLVSLAVSFIGHSFVRSIAERLVFRKAAHANPNGFTCAARSEEHTSELQSRETIS